MSNGDALGIVAAYFSGITDTLEVRQKIMKKIY
jgi:hypothetical protein